MTDRILVRMPAMARLAAGVIALTASLGSHADSGVYVSQFNASDPLAELGGTDPVYLFVAHKGTQAVFSANSFYKPEGFSTPMKVWSYGILTLDTNNAATFELVDFFDVCTVTMETVLRPELITVRTVSSANKAGAANPLNIDCRDLYPLITRHFTLAF
jgi:hypothetical protein